MPNALSRLLLRLQRVNLPKTIGKIVFYCPEKQYWNCFKSVLEAFEQRRIHAVYLSSDEADPGLSRQWTTIETNYIGQGPAAFRVLQCLEADICVLTSSGQNFTIFHRSERVRHYAYLVHSACDMAFYKQHALDRFDSVLCSGPYQIVTLRYLEKIRKLRAKKLFETGCCHMDVLATEYRQRQKAVAMRQRAGNTPGQSLEQEGDNAPQTALSSGRAFSSVGKNKRILIAPTWGKNGLFRKFGLCLLKPLVEQGFAVCVRPHPHSYIVEEELLNSFKRSLSSYDNIFWDTKPSPLESMLRSDVLISDISGIIFDYAFVLERPVITIKAQPVTEETEAALLPNPAWELTVLNRVGMSIDPDMIGHMPDIIASLPPHSEFAAAIRVFRDESLYNFKNAGKTAAAQLLALKAELDSEPSV